MKFFLVAFFCTLLAPLAYSQTDIGLRGISKSSAVDDKDVTLQNNHLFTPTTEPKLFNTSFMKDNSEAGYTFTHGDDKIAPHQSSMPGYYQQGTMMSVVNTYSSVGQFKFYCNYYFDADGQLQDGDITITKIKR